MVTWEGEYQVVRWRSILGADDVRKTPWPKIDSCGNGGPIPMSYGPKLDAVFDGRCTQTIRKGRKYQVGQRRWIFEWSGKPYRSKWGRRMLVEITEVVRLELDEEQITFAVVSGPGSMSLDLHTCWDDEYADELAEADFIDPPTGAALRDVLKGLNKSTKRASK